MGWYAVEIDYNPAPAPNTPEDQVVEPDWRLIATHAFQVEDYRVNTFEVTVAAAEEYAQGAELNIPVSARYFMGKPLSKADVSWMVYAENDFRVPAASMNSSSGMSPWTRGNLQRRRHRGPQLEGRGHRHFLPAGADHPSRSAPRQPDRVRGPTRTSRPSRVQSVFTVHSSDFYLGLREPDGVHRAGDKATFAIAAVGRPKASPHRARRGFRPRREGGVDHGQGHGGEREDDPPQRPHPPHGDG